MLRCFETHWWCSCQSCTLFTTSYVLSGTNASSEIRSRVVELFQQWKDLIKATKNKQCMLEEAMALLYFNRKVDGVLSLIRDNWTVSLVSSETIGWCPQSHQRPCCCGMLPRSSLRSLTTLKRYTSIHY